jgi:hypothetical protein
MKLISSLYYYYYFNLAPLSAATTEPHPCQRQNTFILNRLSYFDVIYFLMAMKDVQGSAQTLIEKFKYINE